MEEAVVTRRTVVLDRLMYLSDSNRTVFFASYSADPSKDWEAGVEIKLTPQAWAEIGLPDKLTLTLEGS